MDMTETLPDEILLNVFKFLPLESLLQCEGVCKRWRKLSQDTSLWKSITIVYSGKPGQTEVGEKNLEILTSHSNCVRCVKLQYVYNYTFITSILEKINNLISIELVMCRITQDFPQAIIKWPKLKRLNLKNSVLLQSRDNVSEMLIDFSHFPDLLSLSLSDFGLSHVNFRSLINCHNLSHIFIEKIKDLDEEDLKECIKSKQNILRSFHIYGGASVDDQTLLLLSQCQNLKDLAIIRCESLTDKGILSLAGLAHLEHLQIWNNVNFTEIGLLKTLGSNNLIKLKSLSLSRIKNVSPVIVDLISEYYKKLTFLALYQCPRIINTDYEKQLKSKFRNIDVVLY